jgi:hypothetical protein
MAIVGALVVALNAMRGTLVVGGILLGFYGFLPAALATDQWHFLDAGAWLGFCGGALMTLGALAVLAPAWIRASLRDPLPMTAAGIAAVGLALSTVAIWPKADTDGSYWNAPSLGHSLGVVMLVLVILAAIGLVAAIGMRVGAGAGLAAVAGLIDCGLLLFIPVGDAFNQLGHLRAGGWLGFFGGLLLAIGAMMTAGQQVMIGISPVRGTPVTPTTT